MHFPEVLGNYRFQSCVCPALAGRYSALAVALLRQAVKAGYNNSQHIGKDPDLDALRSRKDFLQPQRDLPGNR